MSIWCSWDHIGTDPFDGHARGGQVRSYADGFSNHFPDATGDYEQPAAVAVAHVAPWCVPGHRDCDHDHPDVGPWLRLDVVSREHSWVDGGKPTGREECASVVMDRDAVMELASDLLKWLDLNHLQPTEAPDAHQ